ncbi:PREDICTED: uncharacterized protein LOC106805516 [Priapulus caudatus]|uniref:Uncharacterized protein LOC106805516 n=1 Tax=Priapulus caudatus TaxID=37621 RepID=A0ABM1DRQ2_PRICU|nr:PREDICTED: uncharacterized protein LOC106805516 [Priapulus caudatus]
MCLCFAGMSLAACSLDDFTSLDFDYDKLNIPNLDSSPNVIVVSQPEVLQELSHTDLHGLFSDLDEDFTGLERPFSPPSLSSDLHTLDAKRSPFSGDVESDLPFCDDLSFNGLNSDTSLDYNNIDCLESTLQVESSLDFDSEDLLKDEIGRRRKRKRTGDGISVDTVCVALIGKFMSPRFSLTIC